MEKKIFFEKKNIYLLKPIYFSCIFQWAKQLIMGVWPYSLNYASNNILVFFNVFVDHEKLDKELKYMVLSCTVQPL